MPTVPSPQTVLDRVRRDVERNALRARNGLRLVSGVTRPDVGQTPKDVVWQRGRTQLWHYRNDPDTHGGVRYSPPLLVVFSLVSRSYVLRSEEHTSELQSRQYLVCRLLLEKKKTNT